MFMRASKLSAVAPTGAYSGGVGRREEEKARALRSNRLFSGRSQAYAAAQNRNPLSLFLVCAGVCEAPEKINCFCVQRRRTFLLVSQSVEPKWSALARLKVRAEARKRALVVTRAGCLRALRGERAALELCDVRGARLCQPLNRVARATQTGDKRSN